MATGAFGPRETCTQACAHHSAPAVFARAPPLTCLSETPSATRRSQLYSGTPSFVCSYTCGDQWPSVASSTPMMFGSNKATPPSASR